MSRRISRHTAWSALVLGAAVAMLSPPPPALAADDDVGIEIPTVGQPEMNREQIIEQLKPRGRGIVVHAGDEPATTAATGGDSGDAPQASASFASILFEINSAELRPEARATLNEIGAALKSNELSQYSFGVYGHTDASGEDLYNKSLSQQRAAAVREYLATNFGIDPARLEARGFGESRLKDAGNPFSGENRRVEFVNLDS